MEVKNFCQVYVSKKGLRELLQNEGALDGSL
jgi:hypothetical protein